MPLERVCVETVEGGQMTKDLALLIGPDQPWLTTEQFLDAVAAKPRGGAARQGSVWGSRQTGHGRGARRSAGRRVGSGKVVDAGRTYVGRGSRMCSHPASAGYLAVGGVWGTIRALKAKSGIYKPSCQVARSYPERHEHTRTNQCTANWSALHMIQTGFRRRSYLASLLSGGWQDLQHQGGDVGPPTARRRERMSYRLSASGVEWPKTGLRCRPRRRNSRPRSPCRSWSCGTCLVVAHPGQADRACRHARERDGAIRADSPEIDVAPVRRGLGSADQRPDADGPARTSTHSGSPRLRCCLAPADLRPGGKRPGEAVRS